MCLKKRKNKELYVKGAAILSTQLFVKEKFPDRFEEWLNNLPPESQEIFGNTIYPGEWYKSYPTIVPTTIIGEMFYGGDIAKAYYDLGVYSAKRTMFNGIYKDLLQNIDKDELMELFRYLLNFYFSYGKSRIWKLGKNKAIIFWGDFPHYLIDNFERFRGYIEQILTVLDTKTYLSYKTKKKRNTASVKFIFKFEQ